MVNFASIQSKIDRGKGKAASKLGQPYVAYRLGAAASGDFPSGWTRVADRHDVFLKTLRSEREIDTAIHNATLFYDLTADMTNFMLGDVFMLDDGPYDPGQAYGLGATSVEGTQFNAFAFAWHPPVRKAVGGRIDRLCRLFRPSTEPHKMADGSDLWLSQKPGDRPFVLINGEMKLGAAGQKASLVPCGFSSAYRPYGQHPFDPAPPGMLRPTHWFAYLPPLPGYSPREGDTLITSDDARYVVVDPFFQNAGVVGSQLVLDRTTAQKT